MYREAKYFIVKVILKNNIDMSISGKNKIIYEQFKEEAVICNLISSSGKKKKVIRYRGKTYLTASYQQVFTLIRDSLKPNEEE